MDGHASPKLPAHPQPDWVPRRKLSAAEYQRMGEAGILRPEDRVELIEGELIAMSPQGGPHVFRVMMLTRLLVRAVGDAALVAVQAAIRLGAFSEPEPDIALVRPDYATRTETPPQPADMLLVIEVAASTLRYDRGVKAALYARHGIADYWLLDVGTGALLLHRDPSPEGYRDIREAAPGEAQEPALLPGVRLPVPALLG